MEKRYVHVTFDYKDDDFRNMFMNAEKHMPDIVPTQWSRKFKNDKEWKDGTRDRIMKVDVLVVLIGANTHKSEGVLWEIKCAKVFGIPLLGVYCDKDSKGTIPPPLTGAPIIEWSWDVIRDNVFKLCQHKPFLSQPPQK